MVPRILGRRRKKGRCDDPGLRGRKALGHLVAGNSNHGVAGALLVSDAAVEKPGLRAHPRPAARCPGAADSQRDRNAQGVDNPPP